VIASHPLVAALVAAALEGAAPRAGTRAALERRALIGPVSVLAVGKCAPEMMRGALDVLRPQAAMMIALPGAHDDLVARGVEVHLGSHPDPSEQAPAQAARALVFAAETRGTLVALVSGGGSALLELPAEGVTIDRVRDIARQLMRAGADIDELNVVRGALSAVKAGRLAAAARTPVVTLVAEDIPGRPEWVASGPTVPRACTGAREILAAHRVTTDAALERALRRGMPRLAREVDLEVVVDNARARHALISRAAEHGVPMDDLGATLRGEAREAGPAVAREARARGRAVVIGGETTVTVRGDGRGGRNQELVLGAAAEARTGLICSFGTDGIDGASSHAGAYLDPAACTRVVGLRLNVADALEANDSASLVAVLGTAVLTGPTGANAADVCFFVPGQPTALERRART